MPSNLPRVFLERTEEFAEKVLWWGSVQAVPQFSESDAFIVRLLDHIVPKGSRELGAGRQSGFPSASPLSVGKRRTV